MKKRLLALVLAMTMVLGMSMTVFAEGPENGTNAQFGTQQSLTNVHEGQKTVTLYKEYTIVNTNTKSPVEEFEFTEDKTQYKEANLGVDAKGEDYHLEKIECLEFVATEKNSTEEVKVTKAITVTLPIYEAVGQYTYIISETAGDTAGVTYLTDEFKMVVNVTERLNEGNLPNEKTLDATVNVFKVGTDSDVKDNTIENKYEAGSLAIHKEVTGNFGDRNKYFEVTVTLNAPDGKFVKEDITITGGTHTDNEDVISGTGDDKWNDSKTVNLYIKHGETITFSNIPYGVTYSVSEKDYTSNDEGKYDAAKYSLNNNEATTTAVVSEELNEASEKVDIVNNKGINVETGIFTNNMPYILALVAIAAVAVVMFRRKREF